jgi:membrane-associated protein
MLNLLDPNNLTLFVKVFGYVGVASIVFAESGLFFGFFLPGDSLLFTAGILAGSGVFNFPLLVSIIVVAAILGDSVGYSFGRYVGRKLFTKKSSLFFKQEYVHKAHRFYETHGNKAIILARFLPVFRTFVPIMAGVAEMEYSKFLKYNIIGAFLWGVGVTSLGYILGTKVQNIDQYLLPIILGIIAVSFLPIVFELIFVKRK